MGEDAPIHLDALFYKLECLLAEWKQMQEVKSILKTM